MEGLVRGDVVVVPFPFTDLSEARRRPALVVATLKGDDLILCQITSRRIRNDYSIELSDVHFSEGGLRHPSQIRPNKLFTAHRRLVLYRVGNITEEAMNLVTDRIIQLLRE